MGFSLVAVGKKVTASLMNGVLSVLNGLPSTYQAIAATGIGTAATNIGAVSAFAAVPYASTVEATFVGIVANSSATARTAVSDCAVTGAGVTQVVDGLGALLGNASVTLPCTFRVTLLIPANIAATLQIAAHASAAVLTFTGGVTYKRLPQ